MRALRLSKLFRGTSAERTTNFPALQNGMFFSEENGGVYVVVDGAWTKIAPGDGESLPLAGGDLTGAVTSSSTISAVRFLADFYDRLLGSHADDDHFDTVAATFPSGWTLMDAADSNDVSTTLLSFWRIVSTSSNTSFGYRIQSSTDFEADVPADEWISWTFGPLLAPTQLWSADLHWYFGIHGGDGGYQSSIYNRGRLLWDSASTRWLLRGEYSDGTNSANGASIAAGFPLAPLYIRIAMQNSTAQTMRVYAGTSPEPWSMSLIYEVAPTAPATFSNPWIRISHSRGAGNDASLFIGALTTEIGVS